MKVKVECVISHPISLPKTGKMTTKKPTFKRKWQCVLFESLRVSRAQWWEAWGKREAWDYYIDRKYLREQRIKTYAAFERHIRRLSDWSFLYCYPGEGAFFPHRYLVSISGINKLKSLGAINADEAARLRRRAQFERED